MKIRTLMLLLSTFCAAWTCADVRVTLDVEEIKDSPELTKWADNAKKLIEEWHPRITNLIPTTDYEAPTEIRLVFRKTDKGIAWTSGTTITCASAWIEKHPDDIGLVFHELVHVIQQYKGRVPSWAMEGIADYLRWAIFEGKPQQWFPYSRKEDGYHDSYQVTGGFFLWLETNRCPGIVSKLNTAARKGEYKESLFTEYTGGASLQALWADYLKDRTPKQETK